jgi:hypothetical protein
VNENIATALATVADEVVPSAPPGDLWRRGRRRRRVRQTAAVLGVAVIVALAALLPPIRDSGRDTVLPAGPGDAVPARVDIPWLWQATVVQRAPGNASVVFITDRTIYFEATGVVIGRNGAYRILPMNIGDELGPLSPDGRYELLRNGPHLVDLKTGHQRTLTGAGKPIAWSRDGGKLLSVLDRDDAVISYDQNGNQLNNPTKPDDINLVDVATGGVRTLHTEDTTLYPSGAFAPDASRVAITVGADDRAQTLRVLDATTGSVRWSVPLGPNRSLAGPGAWSPDGERIALFAFDGCAGATCDETEQRDRRWRLEYLDATTGATISGADTPVTGTPEHMLGWRYGADPVFTEYEDPTRSDGQVHLVAVGPDGQRDVLLTPPTRVNNIDVPSNLVEEGRFGGPSPRPDPLAVRREAIPLLVIVAIPVLLGARAVVRRLRARMHPRHSGS